MLKLVGWGAIGLMGIIVWGAITGPNPDRVRDVCRQTVAYAAVNVDAWRYIAGQCTAREQAALLRQYERQGMEPALIEDTRAMFARSNEAAAAQAAGSR